MFGPTLIEKVVLEYLMSGIPNELQMKRKNAPF